MNRRAVAMVEGKASIDDPRYAVWCQKCGTAMVQRSIPTEVTLRPRPGREYIGLRCRGCGLMNYYRDKG